MPPERTPEGQWVLYTRDTGQRIIRWPVDARAMLATGEYTPQPPGREAPPEPAASAAPVAAPSAAVSMAGALPAEYAPGVPLVVTRAHDAAPSQPFAEPIRTVRAGKRR